MGQAYCAACCSCAEHNPCKILCNGHDQSEAVESKVASPNNGQPLYPFLFGPRDGGDLPTQKDKFIIF